MTRSLFVALPLHCIRTSGDDGRPQECGACNVTPNAEQRGMPFGCSGKKVFVVGTFCFLIGAAHFWLPDRASTGNVHGSPHSREVAAVTVVDANRLREKSLVGAGRAPAEEKKQLHVDSIRQAASDCAAQRPAYLFVIRIAKCASTSVVELLRGLSREKGFPFVFHGSGAYNWGQREVESVESVCRSRRHWHNRGRAVTDTVVYSRHFYYTPFPGLGSSVQYITFVREPVARVVSSYFYYHFSSKPRLQGLVAPEHRQEGLLQCVALNHEGCTANLMTKYFCGHEHFCGLGSPAALQQAKFNLQHHFLVVGVVEEMEASLHLLALFLPGIFGGRGTSAVPQSNQNEHLAEVSEQERQAVAEHNMADIELYAFALAELKGKLKQCHVNTEQVVTGQS